MNKWIQLALSRNVACRAATTALIVGPILVLINQGEQLFASGINGLSWTKAALTLLVPYLVSTVSSVAALRSRGGE